MALTRKGSTGWVLESYGTLQTDRFGLSSATARWGRYDSVGGDPGAPKSFGQTHPLWTYLTCDKVSVSHTGTHWESEVNFFGVNGNPTPIYELDMRTSEEPIESHPNFATFAYPAGTNGAKYDADGAFLGFYPVYNVSNALTNKEWVGVRGFLSPGAIWRKNYVTSTQPNDISVVGKVDTPEGSPPSVASGRTWLYNGLTWEQRGLVYTVKKEWLLSGREGWNTTIYV
jgi:hypothetical protein